ncbi:collagen binding domain-containing protein [Streptomyces sp. NPDC059874]|uniref:MSCRAMM family protein n=1 Tax=Streptomyces sp. NPDC059874 TaxID=3346983 RepID=UPI0036545B8B
MAGRTARARAWSLALAAVAVIAAAPPADTARVVLRQTDVDTGAPLRGARFELWREANGRPGLQTAGEGADRLRGSGCVTDSNGLCTANPPVGETYYWRQTAAATGYAPPADPVTPFDLEQDDVPQGIVLNVPQRRSGAVHRGAIRIRNQDAKTGRPLRGVVFEVWKETNGTKGLQDHGLHADQQTGGAGRASDGDGVCDFEGLSDGSYYRVERDGPEGYVLPDRPVTGPMRLDGGTPGRRLVVTHRHGRDYYGKLPDRRAR